MEIEHFEFFSWKFGVCREKEEGFYGKFHLIMEWFFMG